MANKDHGSEHYVSRILDEATRDGARPVIRWRDTVITGTELHRSVLRVATALRAAGVARDHAVAILTQVNSPWMLMVRHAAHLLGASVVYITGANHGTITHDLPVTTRVRMLREAGASVLVFDGVHAELAETIQEMTPDKLVLCGLGHPASGTVTVDGRPVEDLSVEFAPQAPELAMVLYTSGTTGQPKGVCRMFGSWNASVLGAAMRPRSHFLAMTAVSHTVAMIVDAALAAGGSVLLCEKFDPADFLRDVATHRITETFMGVAQLYAILTHPDVRTADLSSLRHLLYLGCPASPERLKEAATVLPGVLAQSYGSSEAGRITMLRAADHDDPELLATVGQAMPGVTLAIRDPETGRDLPVNEIGEVVVRSPEAMGGYVADPEHTARVIRDGWLHTGDLGSVDERGYVRLFGRMHEMVKVQDTRVSPSEVEKVLVGRTGVVDACVYGHRRPDLIEELHAAVVLSADGAPSLAALRDHVARAMTPTHAPTRFVRWREFPISRTGKVDRLRIREASAEAHDESPDVLVDR
ncbi:AMP-dependent synthetase [Nocardiopsis gilva YIM 90087]|uniref:AMP-dependent synthetase n=1 Tax=Nocardiopsis gilva YIM 90087 TaxID=1235441 RepID=A0A223S0W9_9ACTN|nr:fatty acid--CoA ligase family protein [Nocardiopsis gilva]ASU81756.1 AMP-dependent synthetase [Nocardiopsis gilva YIM 90087]